jgi:hypothetical protein
MAQDHNNIYSIVERLRTLEEGLDKNQRSVNQLSATFKPKTVAVLTAKTDPKNPLAGKLVGGAEESADDHRKPVEEAVANEEKLLDKVKKSLTDYLSSIEDKYKDQDLKDKTKDDRELGAKDKKDRDLIAKETQNDTVGDLEHEQKNIALPIKTINSECGIWEMHGNEQDGFEIRRGGQRLPSRFKNLDEAEIAMEMFLAHRKQQLGSADYVEEK